MTRDLPPKKSEKIEVRLDNDTKRALQERANLEGVSVSDLIRGLITHYLRAPPSGSLQHRRSQIMRLSSIAAAVCGALFVVAAVVSPARAGDVTLGVTTQILVSPPAGPLPLLDGEAQANVDLDYGRPVLVCVSKAPGALPAVSPAEQSCRFSEAGGYSVLLWAQPGDERGVLVGMRVLGEGEQDRRAMEGAQMLVAAGEPAGSWTTTGGQEVLGFGVAWLKH